MYFTASLVHCRQWLKADFETTYRSYSSFWMRVLRHCDWDYSFCRRSCVEREEEEVEGRGMDYFMPDFVSYY